MKINVLNIDFDYIKGRLVIFMKSDTIIQDKIKLCFIERRIGAGNKLFKPKKVFYNLIMNNEELLAEIQLNEYMYLFSCAEIWDTYIYNETNKKYYIVIREESLDFKYYNNNHYMRNIKPYKTGYNGLSLFSKNMCTDIKCEKMITNNYSSEIYIDNAIVKKELGDIYIRLKRRIHRFLNYFDEVIDLKLDGNKITIFSDVFNGRSILPGDVYECNIVVFKGKEYEYEIPLIANNIQGNYIKSSEYIQYKLFSNSKNILSLFFVDNRKITVDNIIKDNNKLILNLSGKIDGNINKLKLITYKNNSYLKYGYYIEKFQYFKEENKIIIDFEELITKIRSWNNQKFILNCIIGDDNAEEINLQFNHHIGEQIIKNENYEIRLIKGGTNECIFILKEEKNSKIKLAILGSCYSRAAFASSDYYNPGYKEKYDIVFTQFHSSLISLMGNKQKRFEEKYFESLKPINKGYLRADFEKTFFQLLKNSEAEYLIIDIYADAQKGIIIFPDGSIITGNLDVEGSHLMFDLEDGTELLSSTKEINKYIPLWIEAAQRFSKEIVKYIDEKKIIINYSKATETYIDAENNKKVYDNQIDYIRTSNLIMDWMNDYLSYLLPEAQKIDSRNLNYIGFERHPLGNTPNHYESGYYKEFVKLVDNVVWGNR